MPTLHKPTPFSNKPRRSDAAPVYARAHGPALHKLPRHASKLRYIARCVSACQHRKRSSLCVWPARAPAHCCIRQQTCLQSSSNADLSKSAATKQIRAHIESALRTSSKARQFPRATHRAPALFLPQGASRPRTTSERKRERCTTRKTSQQQRSPLNHHHNPSQHAIEQHVNA